MAYTLVTPWQNETWCDSTYFNMYARLAARPLAGGTYEGAIPPHLTDVPRGFLPKVDIQRRQWRIIDANGAVLGRLACQVADALRGKDKPTFAPHLDGGDFVVVINAEKVVLTGKKESDKQYMTYSGWKGGEKRRTVAQIREKHPERLVEHAVRGMLPKNRLGDQLYTKLKVYAGSAHPHAAQQPAQMTYAG